MKNKAHSAGEEHRGLVEESAEDLYENAPCGYISTLPNGLIVRTNQTFLSWTGYTRQELLSGKRFQELLPVGGKIFYETHFAPLLQMQGFVNEVQFELVRKEGAPLPVLVNSIQRKGAPGSAPLNRLTLFNITDRKKYERELLLARQKAEQAVKAKTEFLSMVSHEIRTPLNAIIGIASLLQKTALSNQQQTYVNILQASSDSLLGLLNHLLDFSKIDAGKVMLEERSFNLRQLVHSILSALDVKAEEKNLPVLAEIDERVPACLMGDPIKLGQILTNLVGNAIKFTEMGAVTLTLQVRERFSDAVSIDFAVSDTGIGIAEDRLAHIFEEFTQAHYDIGMKYGGTGLGLAICRNLVELHGGRLGVKSALGGGSSFYFTLRLKIGHAEVDPDETARSRPNTQAVGGLKILVAEDNPINVFMLSQFLRRWGTDFDVVGNGQQAIERVRETDYDLVLMDVRMPELDGYEATRAIRALPGEKFRRLPIIAVTASHRMGLENQLDDAGFTDFLGKPYRPEELAAKLAMYRPRQPLVPAEAPVPAGQEPGPVAPSEADPAGPVRFEKARRMLGDDARAFRELSQLIISNGKQYKHEFQKALETGDPEAFEYQAHKIRPTLELLQAHALRAALQQGRACLAGTPGASAGVGAAAHAIHRELDAMIAALEKELRKA